MQATSKSSAVKFWQFTDKTITLLSRKGNEKEMKIPIIMAWKVSINAVAVLMMKMLQSRHKMVRCWFIKF